MMSPTRVVLAALILSVGSLPLGADAQGSLLSGAALVAALRDGGLVLVMRHANAPATLPDRTSAHPGNDALERQLSESGRAAAEAMGAAIRRLGIRIVSVRVGPAFRTRETARYLDLGVAERVELFGEGPVSMQAIGDAEITALRRAADDAPPRGANALIVTHSPNIAGAFPDVRPVVAEGEALIFRPAGRGMATMVARVLIGEWPRLAATR